MNRDTSEWHNFYILVSGYCRHTPFICHVRRASFQQFLEGLADHFEVPLNGGYLHNLTITSVILCNIHDGRFMEDNELLSFVVEG